MQEVLGAAQDRTGTVGATDLRRSVDEPVGVRERGREWLLHQHVGTVGEPGERELGVGVGWGRDDEDVGTSGQRVDGNVVDAVAVLLVELPG